MFIRPSSISSSSWAISAVQPISFSPSSESQTMPKSRSSSMHSPIIVL